LLLLLLLQGSGTRYTSQSLGTLQLMGKLRGWASVNRKFYRGSATVDAVNDCLCAESSAPCYVSAVHVVQTQVCRSLCS
jgi:hypothetical protein